MRKISTLTYSWTFYGDFCIKPFLPFSVILSFFILLLHCLVFYDLWLMIIPLVSSNFSYNCLVDISILNELPNVSYNCLVDISILNELPNLSYNCLVDISILNELPNFSYNCLVDISILNELPNFSYS